MIPRRIRGAIVGLGLWLGLWLGLGLGLGLSAAAGLAAAELAIMVSAGAASPETLPSAPRQVEIHREIRALPGPDGAVRGRA